VGGYLRPDVALAGTLGISPGMLTWLIFI